MNEYKYGDWTYKLENGNHIVDSPKEIPTSIYKYYPNNEYSRDAIQKQYLFCSHPYHLNDSMDCSTLLWDFSNLSEPLFKKFYNQYGFDEYFEMNYEKEKVSNFEQIKHFFFNLISNNLGIISLTTEPLHTLMWSHYSSEKGLMIELDWKEIKDNLKVKNQALNNYAFFPIQYVDNLESIDFFSKNFNSPDVPFLYSTGIKRKDWSYESEWRFIPYSNGFGVPNSVLSPFPDIPGTQERRLYYPLKAIKSIALGKQFFNGNNVEEAVEAMTYKMKPGDDLKFINFLIENINDRLYWCGEYEEDKKLKRSAEKINLTRLDNNIIKVTRENEGFYQK